MPGRYLKEVSSNQDKKKRKDKKKKKGKPMEDDKENSVVVSEKTKVYQTLAEFSDLQLDKELLYFNMMRYVMSRQELERNRYPVPGVLSGEVFASDGVVCRKCCRCNRSFRVSLDGVCQSKEDCFYHLQRPKYVDGAMVHQCCDKPYGSIGCLSYGSHVCGKPILHNVVFHNIREKRQVRVEQQQQIYALDCEMVYTNLGLQVAKIGIVNLEGLTIYETYVQPDNEIIDYNTQYSGITAKDLQGVTTTLSDVQIYLDQLLNQDTILIGHGLESDLKTLRIIHLKVIDTAVLFPREDGSKQKLKDLALKFLNQTIQDNPKGHDCIEDARTCMALVLFKIKKDGVIHPQPVRETKSIMYASYEYVLSYRTNNAPFYQLQYY